MLYQHLFGLADTKVEHFSISSKFILVKIFKKPYLCNVQERKTSMDFNLTGTKLQDLLIKDEKVTLPGVGELIIESKPATFLEKENKFFPPKKELVFVPSQNVDSKEEFLKSLSGKIRETLALEGEFIIPGVGTFADNGGGEVKFTVNEDFNFAPDNFSLESISLEPNGPVAGQIQEKEPEAAVQVPLEQQQEQKHGPEPEQQQKQQPVTPAKTKTEEHDVAARKEAHRKWMMWILIAVAALAVMILFIMLFKEDLRPLLQNILYTKEELEIMQKWAAQ